MTRPDDIDLMQYLDGELEGADAAEVEAALGGSADGQTVARSLEQVGEVVRTHLELAADDADPRLERMWERVERRIHANGAAGEAEAAPVPARAQASGGFIAGLVRWFEDRRGYVLTGAVTAAAVAVLVLVLRPPTERIVERPGKDRIVKVPVQQKNPIVPVKSEPAEVEELSVSEGTGYILTIPGDDGDNDTTVIWIDPDESKLEGPI